MRCLSCTPPILSLVSFLWTYMHYIGEKEDCANILVLVCSGGNNAVVKLLDRNLHWKKKSANTFFFLTPKMHIWFDWGGGGRERFIKLIGESSMKDYNTQLPLWQNATKAVWSFIFLSWKQVCFQLGGGIPMLILNLSSTNYEVHSVAVLLEQCK